MLDDVAAIKHIATFWRIPTSITKYSGVENLLVRNLSLRSRSCAQL